MLREDLKARPNIYQVVAEACAMQGRKVPIPDVRHPVRYSRVIALIKIDILWTLLIRPATQAPTRSPETSCRRLRVCAG